MFSPYLDSQRKSHGIESAARLIPGAAFASRLKAQRETAEHAASSLFGTLRSSRSEGPQRKLLGERNARNVLIVGAGGLGRRIANYLEAHPEMERVFCGFLDDRKPLGDGIVGRTIHLAQLARTGFVDEVIL